jgi:hypothetical protein
MKCQWQIRRQLHTTADAARRWDRAYHMLLPWSQAADAAPKLDLSSAFQPPLEVTYDPRHLCPRIDRPTDVSPNH